MNLNNFFKIIKLTGVAICLYSPTGFAHANETNAIPVSIYQLIATPERYDGKEVYLIGFMHMEFEGDVVYAHREDWKSNLIQNGIALDVPKESYSSWTKINNTYVAIDAVFSTAEKGHFSLRVGSLTKIKKLVKWSTPKH